MNEREEQRILDLLYEDPEAEASVESLSEEGRRELGSLREVLARVRELPDEDPSPHLDALILAQARAQAEKLALEQRPWWRRLISSPGLSIAMAATATVFVAVLVVPELKDSEPSLYEETAAPTAATPSAAPAEVPVVGVVPAERAAREPEAPGTLGGAGPRADGLEGSGVQRSEERAGRGPPKFNRAPSMRPRASAKGDSGGGASAVGSLAGSGGVATAKDEDRAARDERPILDDMVSRAKAKKEAKAEPPAEPRALAEAEVTAEQRRAAPDRAEAPAPPPAAGLARPQASAPSVPAPAADSAAEADEERAAPRSAPSRSAATIPAPIDGVRARARALERQGDVEGARRYLLATRRGAVGTPMYEQVSYELAELELRHRRPLQAEAFARDVLTTKDPGLASRARRLIRAARVQTP